MFIYFIINFLLTVFRVPSSPSEFLSPYGKKTKEKERKYLVSTEILARSAKHDSTMDPIMAKLY